MLIPTLRSSECNPVAVGSAVGALDVGAAVGGLVEGAFDGFIVAEAVVLPSFSGSSAISRHS